MTLLHVIAALLLAFSAPPEASAQHDVPDAGPALLTAVQLALDGPAGGPAALIEAGTGLTRDPRGGRTSGRGPTPPARIAAGGGEPAAQAARARAATRCSMQHAPVAARAHLATPATLGNPPPLRTHS